MVASLRVFRYSGVQAFRRGSGIHRMDRISGMDRPANGRQGHRTGSWVVAVRSFPILFILFIPVNAA